jgi:hypothetical protein
MSALGRILLWLVGIVLALVWGISALLGSAVAVFAISERTCEWLIRHPQLFILGAVGIGISKAVDKIGRKLEKAWDYVKSDLITDVLNAVDRWASRYNERCLRRFFQFIEESSRLEVEGKHLRAWVARRRAFAAL